MWPYAEMTPDQRYQVLVLVRQLLQAAFPWLEEWQWVQALDDLQLPVYTTGEAVFFYATGLTTLELRGVNQQNKVVGVSVLWHAQ